MGALITEVRKAEAQTGMVALYECLLTMAAAFHVVQDRVEVLEIEAAKNKERDETIAATLAELGQVTPDNAENVLAKINEMLGKKPAVIEVIDGDTPAPVEETPAPTETQIPVAEAEAAAAV